MPQTLLPKASDVDVPDWVVDLKSFRKWIHSGVLPEKFPVHFINGRVWVDKHVEEVFSHNRVKQSLNEALGSFIRQNKLGIYYPDGMLVSNDDAGLAVEPDAMFVSAVQFREKRIAFRAGKKAEATEMVGSPDLVVEVVSPSSVKKDTVALMKGYHAAKVPEYWLIDGRGDRVRFDIHVWAEGVYVLIEPATGWRRSRVLDREFRLIRIQEFGMDDYTLEIR
jgi:Uma2 family endonuclease